MKRVLLLLAVLLLAGCSSYDSNVGEVTLRYGNGITEEKDYKGVLAPGTTNNIELGSGAGDDTYAYPATKRSWIAATTITGDGKRVQPAAADRPAVECVTSDEVRMLVDYAVYFTLNTTGLDSPEARGGDKNPPLRQFHENIGLKTQAWTPDGWDRMLRVYYDQPIEREIVNLCGDYDSDTLRSNNVTRADFAQRITESATDAIERSIGGRYFCGPADEGGRSCGNIVFEVGRPELVNRRIVEAEEQKRIAAAQVEAQENENARINKELEATREEIKALGADNYVLLQAIRSGKVQFMQLPPGANAAVNVR